MKKKSNVQFTNEKLSKKFKSNFDLVNYAIKLAENMISTGRDSRVKSDIQNRAMLILKEIQEGKDQFDEIKSTVPATGSATVMQVEIIEERAKRKNQLEEKHFD